MREKPFLENFGATTATCLRLTEYWSSSGRVVVGDSWFGSVKSAIQLMLVNGLYSIFLVKTAHKLFPKEILSETNLQRGEWNAASAVIDDVNLLAVKFKDLQSKQFISTCSASSVGNPRETRHHGLVQRPKVASDYLKFAAGIDIHNHVRTGSKGLEDVWLTKDAHQRQFTGIMSFLFSNAFLTMKHFFDKELKHLNFKINLANQMTIFKEHNPLELRTPLQRSTEESEKLIHNLRRFRKKGERFQKKCFFCQHGRNPPQRNNIM